MNTVTEKPSLAERVQKLIRATRAPSLRETVPESLAALAEVAAAPSEPVTPASGVNALVSKRVLVAEADPLHRQVLRRLLEKSGYSVETATSAIEAMSTFQPATYGLVLLDCDSPEISGISTAASMRLIENGGPRTPIVAITGSSDQNHRKLRKAAGIDNYLAKPILRENVDSVLARYSPIKTADHALHYLALDRHRLEELDQLAGDRPELLCEWIGLFLASAPELVDRIRAAQEDGNVAALQEAALQLRGRSGQLGALRVQEISGIIGALCESGSTAGVESLVPEVAIAADRAARELRSLEHDIRAGLRLALPGMPAGPQRASTAERDILLVEADPMVSRFLVNNLESADFQVSHITTGRAALEELRIKNFGAAIVDLAIPEVDGYGVLSEMRASPGHSIPVMILSSRRQEQDILRAFELGADDYVTIPFNPMEVVARVRRLVKQGAHVA